jgi:hypothetical protein
MAIWNILWRFGIFHARLVHFVLIWYIFSGFGIMYQYKSGNPGDIDTCDFFFYFGFALLLLRRRVTRFAEISPNIFWAIVYFGQV